MTSLIDTNDSQIVYVNSINRLDGTDSDFTYEVKLRPNNDFNKVVMLACAIPKSFYAVQDGYNTMTLVENGLSTTITIPAANYTRRAMATIITTKLNAASIILGHSYIYSVTYPKSATEGDDGKYLFTVSGNGGIQPQFIFGSQTDNFMYLLFGFSPNTVNIFIGDTIRSTNVINLQAEDAIFIHSDICTNYNNNTLQEIYANVGSAAYSFIYWTNPNVAAYSKKLSGNNNNGFRFYLTNQDGVPLNFNGQSPQFTLLFYREDSVVTRLKSFMEYVSFILFKITNLGITSTAPPTEED